MYKVLHIMNGADSGGISSVVKNYYSFLDRNEIKFDIAITDSKIGNNGKYLQSLGCSVFFLPAGRYHKVSYIKAIISILKEGNYDCIHVHLNESSFFALFAGVVAKIPKRICHAHVKREPLTFSTLIRRSISRILNTALSTDLIACSFEAGEYMYGKNTAKNIKVLNNAIDFQKFSFDANIRSKIRDELNISNKLVIGNVANLVYQKNHEFLIKVFKKISEKCDNAVLVIVGSGELEHQLKTQCEELNIIEKVIFTGRREDVGAMYQAFDVFALTSHFEGFGIVVIEALVSGLKAVVSEQVAQFFPNEYVSSVSIYDDTIEEWCDQLLSSVVNEDHRSMVSVNGLEKFDIRKEAITLQELYLN